MQKFFKTIQRQGLQSARSNALQAQRSITATPKYFFANGKDIKFGTEARALMLEGCEMLADAV